MTRKSAWIIQTICLLLLFTSIAYAQSENPSTRNIGGPLSGAAIAALICYRARKRPVGGWLLYYYIQLYGGALIIGIITFVSLSNYYPQNWDDKSLYTLYLLSTIPTDLANIAEITVASFLLNKRFRSTSTVNLLRGVFVFAFIFSVISIAIDLGHWKESIFFDILGMMWPVIWFLYFTYSYRVNFVFKQKKWEFWANHFYPPELGYKIRKAKKNFPLKLCPSCNVTQNATKKECPNCGFDLTNVEVQEISKPQYPTILRRYMATFIDGMFILLVFIACVYIFSQENEMTRMLQIVVTLLVLFIYEPLCTSKLCTLGQKVMGVRVRKNITYENISIPQAYLRIIVKIFLGIVSFFTVPLTKGKRAIHDFAAGSVVIYADSH